MGSTLKVWSFSRLRAREVRWWVKPGQSGPMSTQDGESGGNHGQRQEGQTSGRFGTAATSGTFPFAQAQLCWANKIKQIRKYVYEAGSRQETAYPYRRPGK